METKLYQDTVEKFKRYLMPTYAPKVLLTRGRGSYLWDDQDQKYLDFASGISVCNLGHCHPGVTRAIQQQAETLVHVSNLYYNPVTPRLAEKLMNRGFDGVVFFANSGAEANEGMIKFARKVGNAVGRNEIITMDHSFHGRTLATLAATGRAKYRKGFEPNPAGFVQVPYNDFDAVRQAITDRTCAILLEPVQGEGGIIPADPAYLRQLRELCDERGILLLFDEVQCGMGRTGQFFAWQNSGVEPDALSMAKALANGFPMGAFMVRRKYAGVLTPGTHASTFGGTPLAAAAALAVQQAFDEEGILENCREQGAYLQTKLRELAPGFPFIREVRGLGLMIGVVLDREAAELAQLLLKHNLIVLTAGETVLRLLPPLNLSRAEADEGLAKLAAGFTEYRNLLQERGEQC